jgi:hypothetical protein
MQHVFGSINKTKVINDYLKGLEIHFNEVDAYAATKLIDVNFKFNNNITSSVENSKL